MKSPQRNNFQSCKKKSRCVNFLIETRHRDLSRETLVIISCELTPAPLFKIVFH